MICLLVDEMIAAGAFITDLTYSEKCQEEKTDDKGQIQFSVPLPQNLPEVIKI